jgi:uncharacterized protein (DUF1015 family)
VPFIAPFKGFRYNAKRIGDLAQVVTLPYDLIDKEAQARYYRRHRWNFIRVVFGKKQLKDTGLQNCYSRARRTLDRWMRSGILQQDRQASVYPYLQEFSMNGCLHRRWGVIALVRLDSPRIYPHEEIRSEPVEDRFRLQAAVEACLSPIFGLIPDGRGRYRDFLVGRCRAVRPVTTIRVEGVMHRLWRIHDPDWIQGLQEILRSREMIIADGHHRHQAAMAYRDRERGKDPYTTKGAPYEFALFYLASTGPEEPGLLPTHRVLHRFPHRQIPRFLDDLKDRGSFQPVGTVSSVTHSLEELRAQGSSVSVGLTMGNGAGYVVEAPATTRYPLDVEWLHKEILPPWLRAGVELSYTPDLALGLEGLRKGGSQVLFVMQRPRLKEVFKRARAGLLMPGKTTFFYPKPLEGLVEYKFGA